MKPNDFNPQTLSTDLEQLIGKTFENKGKKGHFRELEQFIEFLIDLGYKFNLIRELKQVKVIPFKRFVYHESLPETLKQSKEKIQESTDPLQQINTLIAKTTEEGNYELAAAYRDKIATLKSSNPLQDFHPMLNSQLSTIDGTKKILKLHIKVEHSMIHIYLLTRQEWFTDKLHDCITHKPTGLLSWLKTLVGK